MKIEMNLNRVFTLLLLCTLVFASACKKDKDTDDRDNFVGTYTAVEDCDGATDNYEIVITAGSGDNDIVIRNIYGSGVNTDATVDGNKFTIEDQVFFSYGGYTSNVEGDGELSGDDLLINFVLKSDGDEDTCTATCVKQ